VLDLYLVMKFVFPVCRYINLTSIHISLLVNHISVHKRSEFPSLVSGNMSLFDSTMGFYDPMKFRTCEVLCFWLSIFVYA
jgi:hypothetical protein